MDMDTSEHTKSPPDLSELSEEDCNETVGDCTTDNDSALPEVSQLSLESGKAFKDLCGSEETDPETRKNCEARWLQLFQLVERQCQEQIDAQQEQFNHQLQLIREEMKRLAQLQGSSAPWICGPGSAIVPQASDGHPLTTHAGQHSQGEEKGDDNNNSFHLLGELDIHNRAFITQEHFQESTSISSGYGTLSASQPNACLSSCSQNTSRKARQPTNQTFTQCRTESTRHPHLTHTPVNSERPFMLVPDTQCVTHLQTSCEGSHINCDRNSVTKTNQPNSKSLTTWAQKVRHTHPKKPAQMEQISPTQSIPHSEKDFDSIGASSGMFYLNNRAESANSLVSAGSGFTYWMMDEKDMYHPLPDNFETGVSKLLHTKLTDEARIPSLTDIYHRKQKEYGQSPAWEPLSPSEHTHPPEVLTLDPTLHKKPLHGTISCNERYTAPLTPDSILESAQFKQYEEESLSCASSLLGDSMNRTPGSPVTGAEQWSSTRYQMSGGINYQFSQGDASAEDRMNRTEDDANSLTPSSSMPQSPLPVTEENLPHPSGALSVDHPVMLSNIRRSLREKHARHLADLRDYYESEISNLKQQLIASNKSTTSEDLMKINILTERCAHMEGALTEASKRIRVLESKNNELEKQVAEWKERYSSASNTSKDLQEQIEEMRTRSKEKENAISRLQSRLKEVEESFEKTFKQSDDKDERIKQEHKMFQDLLLEYESLGKEHERVKDTLGLTENKLCDSQTELNELRRTVLKLETQIKQLEHENMAKRLRSAEGQLWSSSIKEKVHSTGNLLAMDAAQWKSVTSGTESSAFLGQPIDNKAKEAENRQDILYVPNRYHSPPEKDALHDYMTANPKTQDSNTQESPILKALRDFEEEKELKSWNKESSFHRLSSKKQTGGLSSCFTPLMSPEKSRDHHKRLNSPASPRSSSLPPSIRKTTVTTPTKRELMLTPMEVKYSPKRSPSENLSPGLSQLLCDEENTMTRKTEDSP
ncbi:M-phase phosphoprotein 9 isoform X2 [Hyperolius riggenbachi]|uniref:M-phase phosphoprotein 9 isoform X2 n=1 Tax=Hyperolius riggenbachi TaxID=752182 RepID=UPI0035A2F4BC